MIVNVSLFQEITYTIYYHTGPDNDDRQTK